MRISLYLVPLIFLLLSGCAKPPILQNPAYQFEPPTRQLEYLADVEPVLIKRCVVCHSCYNSPCQLKLSSWDGLERGVSKEQVYNGGRLKTMDPSRLFIDAHSAGEWRQKGFSTVKQEGSQDYTDSLMFMILDHKRLAPKVSGEYFSEATDLTCSENKSELNGYLKKHPNRGMPFGFPPLKQEEFNMIAGWLSQGAYGPSPAEQKQLKAIANKDQLMVEKWETFLNKADPKHQMTARYLYEHLFLAHITFDNDTAAFYELVRSTTGPGLDIDIIPTVRPYDDPGTNQFYYRFRKIYSTIVFKTHMVFGMGEKQYKRVQELFIKPQWNKLPHLIGYDKIISANPFETYAQIPERSRYQWLLDNAHYTIMTFIRGPVCKGQVALNVVNDHFWIMFLDPEYDLAVKYPGFLKHQYSNLRMPGEEGSDYKLYKSLLEHPHYKLAIDYYKNRQQFYSMHYPDGLNTSAIWKGDSADDDPLLTVFRHFDSASVHRGVMGGLPKTMWVVDYPLLERIYYSLVAGFDIYGTAGHQLATRLYMDALRIEGESYFVDFMPEDQRKEMMQDWNIGVKFDDLHHTPALTPTGVKFTTKEPKREFVEEVVKTKIAAKGIDFDQNYLPAGVSYPELPTKYEYVSHEDILNGFIAVSAPGVSFFRHVNDHNANLAWVRITDIPDREDLVVSVVIDRWHDNVRALFREDGHLNSEKDRADFLKGFVGSYPNYFYVVNYTDLPDYFEILNNYDNSEDYIKRLEKYGVNRAKGDFWDVYDWFQKEFETFHKSDGGVVDLNRYYYLAREPK
ncbi:fatty acid cis/trans isomerase [Desulforhopalus sp. 52FAK]